MLEVLCVSTVKSSDFILFYLFHRVKLFAHNCHRVEEEEESKITEEIRKLEKELNDVYNEEDKEREMKNK